MLREALESVRRQTALATITRIVVSENSLNEESRSVCAEFADLPIVYVQQRPPVVALLHIKAIWCLVESPLVAILHDDDWWAPGHLRSALDVLQSDERCVATYSSFLESHGPRSFGWPNQCYFLAWLAAGGDYSQPQLFLDPPSVMLGCLLNAGFHYSTVVGRKEAMWDAFSRNIARGNTFDNDRTFPVFLSRHGSVGYVATPDVFVRQHPFRDAWSPEHLKRGHMKMAQETTRWLLEAYPQEVALAAAKFKSVVGELGPEANQIWRMLRSAIYEPQWSTLVRECGVDLTAVKGRLDHGLLPRWANQLVQDVCPPIVLRWAMQHRILGGWEQQVRRWQKKSTLSKPQELAFNGESVAEKTTSSTLNAKVD